LPANELHRLGTSLQAQGAARRFVNPARRYFDRLAIRYRRFRRERQAKGEWYVKDSFTPTELSPLEVDVVLLALLRRTRSLLADRRIAREFAQARYGVLKQANDLYRTQVAVDEATDFSPIQLACMMALSDPATRSFIGCGDFNQRITDWGTRSASDLSWISPDLEIRSITIIYRHSRQLNETCAQYRHAVFPGDTRDAVASAGGQRRS